VNAFAANKEDGIAFIGGKQKLCFRGANLIEFGHFISPAARLIIR
jgi:hypothetical protein